MEKRLIVNTARLEDPREEADQVVMVIRELRRCLLEVSHSKLPKKISMKHLVHME